jgi:hypothetical protein
MPKLHRITKDAYRHDSLPGSGRKPNPLALIERAERLLRRNVTKFSQAELRAIQAALDHALQTVTALIQE